MGGFGESNLVVPPAAALRPSAEWLGLRSGFKPKAEALGYPIVPGIGPTEACADGGRLRLLDPVD
jgi:hypothetical protein